MTQDIAPIGKAVTAIAAVLALASAPSLAQETAPPDLVADTGASAAPEPTTSPTPVADTEISPPPAPTPKVETNRSATASAAAPSRASTPARPAARRSIASTPASNPAAATPAPTAAEAPLPAAAQPAAPVAEPAPPVAAAGPQPDEMTASDLVPAGAAALGLIAVGGTALAMRRRRRRREDAEYEARQQALATIDEQPPVLDLDRRAEVRPGPAFAGRPAPVHDPVPPRTVQAKSPTLADAPRPQADFMFRRASEPVQDPVGNDQPRR